MYQSIYPLFFENLSSFYFGLTRGWKLGMDLIS
jgi:hypothetical protein